MLKMIKDIENKSRITILLYGEPKVGKTYSLLSTIKKLGHKGIIVSTDGGIVKRICEDIGVESSIMMAEPKKYEDLVQVIQEIESVVNRMKTSKNEMWIIIDTVTQLQIDLLNQARNIAIANNRNTDMIFKIMNTQNDYGANLSIMTDISRKILSFDTNVAFVCLSKQSEDGTISPALVGQTQFRIVGDSDIIVYARKIYDIDNRIEKRLFSVGGGNFTSGSRYILKNNDYEDLYSIILETINYLKGGDVNEHNREKIKQKEQQNKEKEKQNESEKG